MKHIARALVLPVISAGVIGGAALGLAGPAAAATTGHGTPGGHSVVSSAQHKAHDAQQVHPYHQRHRSHNTNWRH